MFVAPFFEAERPATRLSWALRRFFDDGSFRRCNFTRADAALLPISCSDSSCEYNLSQYTLEGHFLTTISRDLAPLMSRNFPKPPFLLLFDPADSTTRCGSLREASE